MTKHDQPTPPAGGAAELDLKIEQRPVAELRPAGRQARRHTKRQLAGIEASIREFGFVIPVLINSKNRLLAGVARVEAAKRIGMTTVPALVIDHLTPEQQRAFVLGDNRLAELGEWNREVLQLELEELSALDLDFSIEITGWTLPEIEAIRFGVGGADPGDDDLPQLRDETVCQVGDLWRLGEHRLLVGDATDPTVLARLMAGEAARTVFTDPPYNVPVQGHVTSSKAHGEFVQASGEMSEAEFAAFLSKVMTQIEAALVEGGLSYVCMDWRHADDVTAAAKAVGLEQINLCVWDKGAAGMGSFYRSQHELIFVLKKGKASHLNAVELGKNGRNRSNVWAYEGVAGFGSDKAREREMHPTVKPLALVKDTLLDCTRKGDVVLDLFGGSGTTLIAAEKTGRRCRMTELDPKYADVIIRRWEAVSGQEAVQEQLGQTFRSLSYGRPEADALPPVRVRVRQRA